MYSAENLSAIELAILRDIASGYHSKEIAVRLGRSKPTIEMYVRMLCAKLAARSRAHLVSRAYEMELLELPPRDSTIDSYS